MEIIISANEKILAMTQNEKMRLWENMSEQEYKEWIYRITGEEADSRNEIQ